MKGPHFGGLLFYDATQRLRARCGGLPQRASPGGREWRLIPRSAWADDAAIGAKRATTYRQEHA